MMRFKKRLFLAIPLSEEIIKALSSYEKQFPDLPHARWVPPENFHITVQFIGWVDEKKMSHLTELVENVAFNTSQFLLTFDKVIWAPPDKMSRMIWVQFQTSPEFRRLSEKMHKALKEFLTRETEPEIIPHITLVRFDQTLKVKNLKIKQPEIKREKFKVNSIYLMESHLAQTGPTYEKLMELKFSRS